MGYKECEKMWKSKAIIEIGIVIIIGMFFTLTAIGFATGDIYWECTCIETEMRWVSRSSLTLPYSSDLNLYDKEVKCVESVCELKSSRGRDTG